MKKIIVSTLACLLMFASIATADHTEFLGGGLPSGGQFFGGTFNVAPGAPVDGIEISFDIAGVSPNGSWASDMQFEITGPSGSSFAVGGFNNPAPNSWSFQGTTDGFYSDSFANPFNSNGNGTTNAAGEWSWRMTNDWSFSAPVAISNLTVTLSQVPEPTSLAMVGMAVVGLMGRRRRR